MGLNVPLKDINQVTGYLRKELDYLLNAGYELSADGLRMVRR